MLLARAPAFFVSPAHPGLPYISLATPAQFVCNAPPLDAAFLPHISTHLNNALAQTRLYSIACTQTLSGENNSQFQSPVIHSFESTANARMASSTNGLSLSHGPSSSSSSKNASYLCDTLPAARLASRSPSPAPVATPPVAAFRTPILNDVKLIVDHERTEEEEREKEIPWAPAPRKLCVRHQRMADEGTNLKLQQVGSRA